MQTARDQRWLPHFRRAMAYLGPHRRSLIIGLLAAVGVSIFYTFSVSSIVPVLKIIFAEHESLVDWLHRAEAQRRLGAVIAPDMPDDPRGVPLVDIRPASPNAGVLHAGDRITAIDGETQSSFALEERIANDNGQRLARVRIVSLDGDARDIPLTLLTHQWWWTWARRGAEFLPAGRTPADRSKSLLILMVGVVLISTIGAVFRFVNEGFVAIAVQLGMHDLRTNLADHTLRLPIQWHSLQPPGDTLGRFATDINKVEVGISTLFGKVIREPLKAAGVLFLAFLLDWRMLIIGVVGLPIGALFIRLFGRLVKRAQRRASESWGRLLDHLGERLAGIRIVKAYNMQSEESRRFADEGRVLTRAQTNIELVDAASSPVLETLAALAVSAFILYGGSRVFRQELEPHLFFGAVICLGGIFDPLRKMGNVYNRLQAAEASARRLFEVMDLPTEEDLCAEAVTAADVAAAGAGVNRESVVGTRASGPAGARVSGDLPRFRDEIEFRHVTFSYPTNPDRHVLDDITLRVRKGQVVALVGPNGSGKTTLVSLLLRFFEPTGGQILIDGHDIAGLALSALRAQFGLVTQDAVVFSGTVRENIAYGANGVTDEAVHRAACQAHVDDFVRDLRVEQNGQLTTGYDARINSRTLSGGQRQRIVLARAILRDPPVLILDEATSQVDSESERKIQEALEDVTRDRTTFIIAHRFSTIARADLTVVLNEGRIVGQGRHDELLATCPFYVTLVETQFAHAT